MTVQRYRRKPRPEPGGRIQFAARYEPGKPLDDLAEVAAMALDAQLSEVPFASGPTLTARFTRVYDDRPPRTEYVMVEPGGYLAYDEGEGFLYASDDRNWEQFYDLEPGEGARP